MRSVRSVGAEAATLLVAVVALMFFAAGPASLAAVTKCSPSVATYEPTAVTPLSVILHGAVADCRKAGVTAWFVIRESSGPSETHTPHQSVPSGRGHKPASYALVGLKPGESVSVTIKAKVGRRHLTGNTVTFRVPAVALTTLAATSITGTSAVLHGTANPAGAHGLDGAFRWAPASGGAPLTTAAASLPSDAHVHAFQATLSGLSPDTKYSFDAIVTAAHGPLVPCGCVMTFTTGPGPATSLAVTAPASANAGQPFNVSASTSDAHGTTVDATATTMFTISPDGSCMGSTCTATTAGPHTVHGVDGGFSIDASQATTIDPGPLDHLKLSPATAHVCALQASSNNAEYHCPFGSSTFQAFTAEGFDQYGNDLGDKTADTTFGIPLGGGDAACGQSGCSTGASTATFSVQGTDGNATGVASLAGDVTLNMTCQGTHYDVDGNPANGCEVSDSGVGVGTKSLADSGAAAASAPECDSGTYSDINISGTMPSDARTHADPAVTGFDATSGSTPDWFWISPISGSLCNNDLVLKLATSGEATSQSNSCYELKVITDQVTYSQATSSIDGTASITHDTGGQFSDGTHIDIEVSKTCTTTVTEDVSWTLTGHL